MSSADSEQQPQGGITNVQLGGERGLLSPLADPLGNGLQKGLSPVGNAVGGLTQSVTGTSTDLLRGAGQALGITKTDDKTTEEESRRVGGKEQTADNPLGL